MKGNAKSKIWNQLYEDMIDLNVLGMNSGTSMDGIDVVLCNFKQASTEEPLHLKVLAYDEMEMPPDLKNRVLKVIKDNMTTVEEMSQISALLGIAFAKAAKDFCSQNSIEEDSIDVIGSHGQTVWYVSETESDKCRSVLTLAEPCYIVQSMNKTVVSDFRVSEQSVGRQGAPMIAFFDSLLLIHPTKFRACQNIGGIANVCFVFPESEGGLDKCFDFDNGPGNVFIDAAMRYFTKGEVQYDKDGEWGKQGVVNQKIVDEHLNGKYFKRSPPKTTGRELFGDSEAHRLIDTCISSDMNKYDTIATLTRITAESIVRDYKRYSQFPIEELYLCGGGAFNPNITEFIQKSMPQTKLLSLDVAGIQGSAKEAITFAFQGFEAIVGRTLIVPDKVETQTPVIVGKVTPGKNYRKLQKLAVEFSDDYDGYLPPVTKLVLE